MSSLLRQYTIALLAIAIGSAAACGCASAPKNRGEDVLRASHDRSWIPNHGVLPRAEIEGTQVSLRNIRNTRYITNDDYIVQHYDAAFDLNELRTVDFVIVPFRQAPSLAHTMLSFGFEDGRQVMVSVEARMEEGEQYSPLQGALRQYELMYILGDERDLIPLRTRHRNVDVHVYRSTAPPDRVRRLFLDILKRVNEIERQPEFYDTVSNNCTSNIVRHINRLNPGRVPWDIRVLLPGYSDQLAFDLGLIERKGSFTQTRRAARVTDAANVADLTPDFSRQIRRR